MSRIRSTSVLLLLVLLFACGPGGEGKQAVGERYGGVFNFNETQVVRSLFPLQVKLVSEQRVASQVYEGLVRFDPSDFSILPCLAESWEVDAGRTVYTFRLRQARWLQRCFTSADPNLHCPGLRVSGAHMRRREQG